MSVYFCGLKVVQFLGFIYRQDKKNPRIKCYLFKSKAGSSQGIFKIELVVDFFLGGGGVGLEVIDFYKTVVTVSSGIG